MIGITNVSLLIAEIGEGKSVPSVPKQWDSGDLGEN